MNRPSGPAAAIAGLSPGVQGRGVWIGRRQLFVRFAAEAETAVLYTAERLGTQIARALEQSPVHSVAFSGADPLANAELIVGAVAQLGGAVPVMIDCEGERPEAIARVAGCVAMIQVVVDFDQPAAGMERVLASLAAAERGGAEHTAVLEPREGTSDGQILRFVEQAHASAPGTKLVIHPPSGFERGGLDLRYAALLEQTMMIHPDAVLLMRVPAPIGTH
jgi:hypothetical protein